MSEFRWYGADREDVLKKQGYGKKSRDQLVQEVHSAQAELRAVARAFEEKGIPVPAFITSNMDEANHLLENLNLPQVKLSDLQFSVGFFVNSVRKDLAEARGVLHGSKCVAEIAEVALHEASAAAHREVSDLAHDFYDKKIFDPYLKFASAEDEEAYRRQEDERQRYIKEQLAKGTPEGNLNAADAMLDQMKDAKAHGADASPEFQSRYDAAEGATTRLRAALRARGSEVERPERSAIAVGSNHDAMHDPLDAIAPNLDDKAKAALATFKAAGIVVSETAQPEHGVTNQARPGQVRTV